MALQHLKSLQAIDMAVRKGSLAEAAVALGITSAAVGQRIKTLEDYLGLEILMRGRRGLRIAPEFTDMVHHLNTAFDELHIVSSKLELQRGNEIHIAADSDWIDYWLTPRMPEFREKYPNLKFCLNGVGDARSRIGPTDCEVRFSQPDAEPSTDLLFREYIIPIGSKETVERVSGIENTNKLEGFPLLHLDFYNNDPSALNWIKWIERNGMREDAPDRGIRFRRIKIALESVRSNAGFTLAGVGLIQSHLEKGIIIHLFPNIPGEMTSHAFCARFRSSALTNPMVRKFRSWMLTKAHETQDRIIQFSKTQ